MADKILAKTVLNDFNISRLSGCEEFCLLRNNTV
jgi:hypothetical protein